MKVFSLDEEAINGFERIAERYPGKIALIYLGKRLPIVS